MKDIVLLSGFLSSGKTSLLKKYVDNQRKNHYIIQCENGIEKIENAKRVKSLDELVEEILKTKENLIYVEFNGTWNLSTFIGEISSRGDFRIHTVYLMDMNKIYKYMVNFPTLIMEQINYAEEIVYINEGEEEEVKKIKDTIKQLKPWISYKKLDKAKMR